MPQTIIDNPPDLRGRPVPRRSGASDLIGAIVSATAGLTGGVAETLEQFLQSSSSLEALRIYLGMTGGPAIRTPRQLRQQLGRDLARIDALLSRQVNAILHHSRFQQLEASWRGVRLLVQQTAEEDARVHVKVLTVSKRELYKDLDSAIEFDQSHFFRKIYTKEFDMPGGQPFGVLVGDYEFSRHPEDVRLLAKISEVAALSFCPFIAGAAPALFELRSFTELQLPRNLERQFQGANYIEWRQLRQEAESSFVGLTAPHILMRLPYGQGALRDELFDFREDVSGPGSNKYLWGNAAYAFAHVLMRAFVQTGWLAEIRGVVRGAEEGGLVTALPVAPFGTDQFGVLAKCPTDFIIADTQEKDLAELGLIPLCHCQGTEYCAFYGCPSLREPKRYDELTATMNARVSAMLPYVFCASRFAHYLNAMARDLVGSTTTAEELQRRLNNWVQDYVLNAPTADPNLQARRPLRAAQCKVRERPGKPGSYDCLLLLQPHYRLDAVTANVELKALHIHRGAGAET